MFSPEIQNFFHSDISKYFFLACFHEYFKIPYIPILNDSEKSDMLTLLGLSYNRARIYTTIADTVTLATPLLSLPYRLSTSLASSFVLVSRL
ncbi:hypothetical protein RCL_jg23328.t1 [Rhizophagus clarus]|uniref:Uncharacterized protein n=1 Tax=Rhizophagus clarus TaxID=94130 RepID=A0A8H3QH74_9GLOM|nr:hypothetical protein RCL_jg23328.t1 [Rhizophagus clarus]